MTPIRLMIVDDHTLFREGLSAIFLAVDDIEVVVEADSGTAAIQQARAVQPDVILMDIQMDDINGIDACRQILAVHPHTKIIMLTMLEDNESLSAAMMAGAKGYVLKGADKAEVLRTIRAAAAGEVLFGANIASRVMDVLRNQMGTTGHGQPQSPFGDLTDRELEVLALVARGHSNHQIAGELHIAAKTVSNHISNIFSKLDVTDRTQAMLMAREAGLGID